MELINTTTQEVTGYSAFKALYPNTSFPRDPANIPFEDYGFAVVQPTARPEVTALQKVVEGAPVYNEATEQWQQTWVVQDRYDVVDDAAEAMCHRVDMLRDEKLRSGYTFTHSDEAEYTLQTRGEEDRVNWLGRLNGAQVCIFAGLGESQTMDIRTAENVTLTLNCNDIQSLLVATLNHQSSIYAAAWQHKDALRGYTTMQEVADHDITAGWPA